ncbi:MAG: flavodoxin domain-containing protein, partial [Bacillota bacterium]|nr:flavodoxin domain-containing protein [Bacillota bacterium]
EVMMTYEEKEGVLFSADAFGKFGALDGQICRGRSITGGGEGNGDRGVGSAAGASNASNAPNGAATDDLEDWACEARRYYIGIVGKYGAQVQPVLKKAAALDIKTICPLHGPVLTGQLADYLALYDTWSSYEPETKGVCICYTSVYGNTKKAVELLQEQLLAAGEETVVVNDLARCDMAEAVEDAFRYDRLVLATTTYNSDIFPFMNQFIDHLTERNFRKRFVGFMENGSWGPMATRIMKAKFEKSKELIFAENNVTIKSALNEASTAQVKALAKELAEAGKV